MEHDDKLSAVADLPITTQAASVIAQEVDKRERAVDNRIFALLNKGEALDPQVALQAWFEKKAIRDLKSALLRRQAAGQGAGRQVADIING